MKLGAIGAQALMEVDGMRDNGWLTRVGRVLAGSLLCGLAASAGTEVRALPTSSAQPRVLIVGGGSSHDFATSFGKMDVETLRAAGDEVEYTESFAGLRARLGQVDTVVQASNQAMPDAETRRALMEFVARGGGLVVVHAGTWYNWPAWPEYNRTLVGGGTREHDRLGRFEVTVAVPEDAVMRGVPAKFEVEDELYHQEMAPDPAATEVLATAHSGLTGKTYPSVWLVKGQKGRIVCLTLGHDERVHTMPAYQTLLRNAVAWTSGAGPRDGARTLLPSSSLWAIDVPSSWSSDNGPLSADKTLRVNEFSQRRMEIVERFTAKDGRVDELGWAGVPDAEAEVTGKAGVRGTMRLDGSYRFVLADGTVEQGRFHVSEGGKRLTDRYDVILVGQPAIRVRDVYRRLE